jgi:hypothetical protein
MRPRAPAVSDTGFFAVILSEAKDLALDDQAAIATAGCFAALSMT